MIIILMGVSGSGKTTVGSMLADGLGWEFLDGDEYHSPAGVTNMASGIPLTEENRKPWLQELRQLLSNRADKDCILACSALTENFRRKLLKGYTDIELIHLAGDFDLIKNRMEKRRGHYFKAKLLESQFETLEEPEGVRAIDISKGPDEIVKDIRKYLEI
jgi:gluconokinase